MIGLLDHSQQNPTQSFAEQPGEEQRDESKRQQLAAQQPPRRLIGFLTTASPASRGGEQLAAFHNGLRQEGYSEGQNVRIEYRWASDDYSLLRVLAKELVDLRVAVIVAAGGHVSALAAHEATKEIPIAFTTVTDPVEDGLVSSLNRPGGNATGTAGLTSELDPKRLEFLREAKPTAARTPPVRTELRMLKQDRVVTTNAWRLSNSWSERRFGHICWEQMSTPIACAASSGTDQTIDVGIPFPLADMTGTTSRMNTSRRHYGGPFSCTPRADDGRLVPAGLLAHGSCASPPPSRRMTSSGTWGDARRLQLRGQPRL